MDPAAAGVLRQGGPATRGGIRLLDLTPENEAAIEEIVAFLPACFEPWRYLQTPREARGEVLESLAGTGISRIAVGEHEAVLGWCGGIPEYSGRVWELHPMAVRPDQQRKRVGRMLLADFEACVRQRGGLTVVLGTDDVAGASTAHGVDLYPDVWRHIRDLTPYADHPFVFYRKCGYMVHGLIPDANGRGKPAILMAKRVAGA